MAVRPARVGPAVEFDAATHRYRSGVTIGPLTFRVAKGEVVALLGHNGSGKTTALRMALGLAHVHDGAVLVNGHPVAFGQLPDQCSGIIEKPAFLPQLTGAQNLELSANGDDGRRSRIAECMELVGLGDIGKRVSEYSLGMKQRLAIARVLISAPSVLVLDEPANGLDPEGVAWFHGLIRGLADSGRTILIASHLVHELSSIADDTVSMDAGKPASATFKATAGRPEPAADS